MPHVITQSCCSDASCVYACPVNCIQPTPDQPEFLLAEMLHIDPAACVDCGACVSGCPVGAIKPANRLTAADRPFVELNAAYFRGRPARSRPVQAPVEPVLRVRRGGERLRVAIVGSGPAGMYAADEILTIPGARVTIFEREPAPYGLARLGVAPDHPDTRRVAQAFDKIAAAPGLTLRLGVEVGRDISHGQLLAAHDAVIYAVGAAADRPLALPGADLRGVSSATDFVAWYNGRPRGRLAFDLATERAVVIGNGNVALDVARMLTRDPRDLAQTEIAPLALRALQESRIREVVVTGRREPARAAFTLPELIGLAGTPGVGLVVDPDELTGGGPKVEFLRGLPAPAGAGRRIVLRFGWTPEAILGVGRVGGVAYDRGTVAAGIVFSSIGYRAQPLPWLPFDSARGVVPNDHGRVTPGVYVAGWIKRGPSGLIGTNRSCALETVRALVDDFNAGRLRSFRVGAPRPSEQAPWGVTRPAGFEPAAFRSGGERSIP